MTAADGGSVPSDAEILLWWIPVGAGGHVVRHTSRWWEVVDARLGRRRPQPLFHTALEVSVDGTRSTIEMAPAWGGPRPAQRGVVRTGPVGARLLGGVALFRYEVRCWRGGTIPDLAWAEGPPAAPSVSAPTARALLDRVRCVPDLTWGRTVGATADMWNSNSVVAWLLATADVDTTGLGPPAGGRAPGWVAGLAVAREPALAVVTRRRGGLGPPGCGRGTRPWWRCGRWRDRGRQ